MKWRLCVALGLLLAACNAAPASAPAEGGRPLNPVSYFEIPVADMDRAIAFYTSVFGYELQRTTVDGYDMALFPAHDGRGASGALAQGDVYVPSTTGVIIYFSVDDIDPIIERAVERGGRVLYPKTAVADVGYVAEIADSEGNRIALHAATD